MGLFSALPKKVSIYEVSPRDGLQNERATVPLSGKVRLIDALVAAGLSRIEVTSFVSPQWIPQLADADDLVHFLEPREGVTWSALCPNDKGFERAKKTNLSEIAVFMSSSETHNKKNVNKTTRETLHAFAAFVKPAIDRGMRVRGYVSTVWGCPYEGDVPVEKSLAIAEELLAIGCYQVSLGDTIGVGTPVQTKRILEAVLAKIPAEKLAMHMHDTRGTALANIVVGLELGIRDFDSSIGGMGGCPYAPGAAGNVATEDLVYMLHGMGIETGLDLERLVEAGKIASGLVGRALPSKVQQSGARSLRA